MMIKNYFSKLFGRIQAHALTAYLIVANMALIVFAIVFSNAGMLPFKSVGDFSFFAILALMLAIYRPGWGFLFFIGSLALENINLAPANIGISVRPYQFMALVTIVALIIGFSTKRLKFDLPKWKWVDALAIVFAIGGFLGALGAIHSSASLKQAVIAATFVVIYFLVRVYVQNIGDLKRIIPFFLSSGVVVALYGVLQNIRFARGLNSFEVMPGRPNGTFTEADWLGIYLTFLLSVMYAMIYYSYKNCDNIKSKISNFQFPISKQFSIIQFFNYALLALVYIVLILTVSRSAWLGAVVVTIGFLKAILIGKSHPENQAGFWNKIVHVYTNLDWKAFLGSLGGITGVLIVSVGIVYVSHLTTFQIFNRVQSTSGLQKITIACESGFDIVIPQEISNVNDLAQYHCRHINLENIAKEKAAGNVVEEVYRPDPNIGIRSKIYHTANDQIKQHPIFGIGWGSIGTILGKDDRGASLNASNIFLETWLGAGLLGFLSLIILLGYIFVAGVIQWLNTEDKAVSIFILLALFATIIPNLFNSGIFLGFVWVYLAVAVSLLQKES